MFKILRIKNTRETHRNTITYQVNTLPSKMNRSKFSESYYLLRCISLYQNRITRNLEMKITYLHIYPVPQIFTNTITATTVTTSSINDLRINLIICLLLVKNILISVHYCSLSTYILSVCRSNKLNTFNS